MCGFVGFTQNKELEKYENILNHRGPDSVNNYRDDYVSLLHNRLSVIDLTEEAAQPMVDLDTDNVIVFNGEIYNFNELKNRFNLTCYTQSDTEVILKLYAKLGINFIDELNGIFAFVIYDKKQKKLLAYRDRFGIKPLFYKFELGNFSFSSEIKVLIENTVETNFQMVYEYLEFGLLQHNNDTFFTNIHSLEAAHFLEYDLNTKHIEKKRYWDIPNNSKNNYKEHDVIEQTYGLLNDSLKLNLVSDVDIAISLSSGTDSTLLTKLAQNHQQYFKAFTFGFEENNYDEVRKVKENFDLSSLELYPTYLKKDRMLDVLEEAIYYFETPLGGLGTLSAYNMMKEVRQQKIKVILAGEGSDEVFGGYQYYYPAFFSDIENERFLIKELDCYNKRHNLNLKFNSKEFYDFINLSNSLKVLAPDGTTTLNSHIGEGLQRFKIRDINRINKFKNNLSNIMYRDMFIKKLPKLLHFQDRASMANSVESRVPFLDHRLVEFLYSLNSNYKIKNGETKFLLKEILRQKFNYQEKVQTKHYVATPQREWLKDSKVYNQIIETIRYGYLVQNKLIDFEKFYKDYKAYSSSKELGNSFFVWKIINLEYLLKQKWI